MGIVGPKSGVPPWSEGNGDDCTFLSGFLLSETAGYCPAPVNQGDARVGPLLIRRCRILRFTAVLALLLLTPALAEAQRLEGVWRGTAVRTIGGPNDGQVTQFDRLRLLIYTDSFFMWAFETSDGPRALLPPPGEASDGQLAEAFQGYSSNAGTYIRDGNQIIYNRLLTMAPNGMQPENQPLVREIRLLTRNRLETQLTNDQGVTTVLIYERVE